MRCNINPTSFISVTKQVGKFNWLHVRTDAKLRSLEVLACLRARALIFVHYFQPMMIMAKHNDLGYKYLDQGPFIRKAVDFCNSLEQNPSMILDRDLQIFNHDAKLCQHMNNFLTCHKNKPMVDCLFEPAESNDMVLGFVSAYATTLRERLLTGSTNQFLGKVHGAEDDGVYLNPTATQRESMSRMPLTTDKMEGMFGKVDLILSTNSCNLSFFSAAAMTCWLANDTSGWLQTLTRTQELCLVRLARHRGVSMARDHRKLMKTIAVVKNDSRKALAVKRKERLRSKVEQALAMDQDARTIRSRLTLKAFREEQEACKSEAAVLKHIKVCNTHIYYTWLIHTHIHIQTTINTLIAFYPVTRAQLMVRYSKVGVGLFPCSVVVRQYELLLGRIQRGELVIGRYSSVLDAVTKQAHVFRNGKLSAAAKRLAKDMRVEIEELILSCRERANKLQADARTAERRGRTIDPKLGAKVMFSGDRWDIAGWHLGVITEAGKIPRKRTYGYKVRFIEDGVTEWFSLSDLEKHFVTGSVTAADAADDISIIVGDRVYCAWQDTDQWYYGTVTTVNEVDGVNLIDVRYDDGTSECGVTESCSQFISRPDVVVAVEESSSASVVLEEDKLIKILTVGDSTIQVDDNEADELWEL